MTVRNPRSWPLLVVLVALIGCAHDPCDDVGVFCECDGELYVTVRLSTVPAKLQIVWNGRVAVDECNPVPPGPILYERKETELVVNDGGFGFAPPSTFSLVVNDLKDCVEAPAAVIVAEKHPVPGAPFEPCTTARVTLE